MISQTSERHSLEDASKGLSRMLHFSCSIEEDVYFQCKKEMVPARPEIDMVLVKLIDILGEIAIGIFDYVSLLCWHGDFFPKWAYIYTNRLWQKNKLHANARQYTNDFSLLWNKNGVDSFTFVLVGEVCLACGGKIYDEVFYIK